ncbi:MAG TPA: CVNH domain-containing protein, partial [Candidatus Angelobacter sp.]|nr:CVNH domain-containing protein [Candidatus Angelobacter sp.]
GGRYRSAFLDAADRCWGDISNNNGRLVCEKNGTLPAGDYSQSCRDVRVRYGALRAHCQDRTGAWVDTSLEAFSRCNGVIQNIDGQLRCVTNRERDHDRERDWDRDRERDHDGDRDRDHDGDRDRDHDGDRDRRNAPRGSYSQSCREIETRGDSLRAVCQTVNGNWIETGINDYDRCVGDIVNDDGRLECTRRGGRLVPVGSYSQSCRNVYVRGDDLRAMCQGRDGRWVWSELRDWDDCRRGIVNENGNLRCVR